MATKTKGRPTPFRFRIPGTTEWGEVPNRGQSVEEAIAEFKAAAARQITTPPPVVVAAPSPDPELLRQLQDAQSAQQRAEASTASLEQRLAALEARLAEPDIEARLALSESVSTNLVRTLSLSEQVAAAQQQVIATAEQATQQATQATNIVAAANELQNQLMPDVGNQINSWRDTVSEQEQRLAALTARIEGSWEIISRAEKIEQTTRKEAIAALADRFKEFEANTSEWLSVALFAMGLTQSDIDLAVRRLADGGLSGPAPVISPLQLQVFQSYARARQDAEQRTNVASANSAGRLDAANGPKLNVTAGKRKGGKLDNTNTRTR